MIEKVGALARWTLRHRWPLWALTLVLAAITAFMAVGIARDGATAGGIFTVVTWTTFCALTLNSLWATRRKQKAER